MAPGWTILARVACRAWPGVMAASRRDSPRLCHFCGRAIRDESALFQDGQLVHAPCQNQKLQEILAAVAPAPEQAGATDVVTTPRPTAHLRARNERDCPRVVMAAP